MLSDGEPSSPLAARLDLLLQRVINVEQFEADMVRECRRDPEEVWTLLALLDQYHRQESLPTELFRALKASAERYGLVRREPYNPYVSPEAGGVGRPAGGRHRPRPARRVAPPAPTNAAADTVASAPDHPATDARHSRAPPAAPETAVARPLRSRPRPRRRTGRAAPWRPLAAELAPRGPHDRQRGRRALQA